MESNIFIITGGSGSGKTSLINHLNTLGYKTHPEVSRSIIKEQQKINGALLPWGNLYDFGLECLNRMNDQLENKCNDITFFDRGIPDILAYYKTQNLEPFHLNQTQINKYNSLVFICPPWQEIFVNDPQRPETFNYSSKIDHNLRIIYQELGFNLVDVPKASIETRSNFIIEYLEKHTYLNGTLKTAPSLAR